MSVASKKITIYSSPQLLTPLLTSHQVDCNQNSKLAQVSMSNFSVDLKQTVGLKQPPTLSQSSISAPQRTTLRLRISNPKELELLQSAASRGCATLGGRQVRIVSVQPSSVPTEVTTPNLIGGQLRIQSADVNSQSPALASSQLQTCIRTSDFALTSSQNVPSQMQFSAQTRFCLNSSSSLRGGVASNSVNSSALPANFLSIKSEMPCLRRFSGLVSESIKNVASCRLNNTASCLLSSKSLSTDSVLTQSEAIPVPLSNEASCCQTETVRLPSLTSTASSSSEVVTSASTVPFGLFNMESQPISHHSSVTIRTMASQGAKYLGTFAVNADLGDSKNKNGRSPDTNSQRVVLRISSKNNMVDVKSLMSAERLPDLVKAIEKVLSEKGIQSSTASIMHQVGGLRTGNDWNGTTSRLEKFVPSNTTKTNISYNGNKRLGAFDEVINSAKKLPHCNSRTEENFSSIRSSVSTTSASKTDKKSGNGRSCSQFDLGVNYDGCSSILSFDKVVSTHDQKCARIRPFVTRKKRGTFSFLMSYYRRKHISRESKKSSSERSLITCGMPVAIRFRYLRSSVHKTVGVFRSGIHGLGLFARRKIDESEMIVEYAGEVIRSSVADVRERHYESVGIGCYMFRHGEDDVVDATRCGNVARFINHSCEPNCYSREIVMDGRRHIVIFALRCIQRGEELTYDYKFPIEDVKMLCMCNARRCRKYLN